MDEWIIACTETLTIWNFYNSKEDAEDALPFVKGKYQEDAEMCLRHHEEYGHREPDYWLKQSEKYKLQSSESRVMTFDEYVQIEADKTLSKPITEITEEQYEDALNVLPPLKYGYNRNVLSFFMSEFDSGNYTRQYARMNGKFYSKVVNYRKPETWIQPQMVEASES